MATVAGDRVAARNSPGPPATARIVAIASSTWVLGIGVFALTWGGGLGQPLTPSIDHSLHAGLQMAAERGFIFGPDFLFTYGPLGFLKSYLVFVDWPSQLAGLYGLLLHLAVSISLVWAIRRNFNLVVAVALAITTASLARGDLPAAAVRDDAAVIILALIWSIAALQAAAPEWIRRIVVYGGGVFAAVEMLAKLNTGIIVLAIVVLAIVAIDRDRWRNLLSFVATFSISAAALWLATGQGLDNVGPFLSGTVEIISGYSSGARLDFGWQDRGFDYLLAPVVMALAVGIAWISTRQLAWRPRAAALVIAGIVLFTAAKGGFVSHEIFHIGTFYPTVLGLCLVFELPGGRPRLRFGALAATAFAAAAGFTAAFLPGYPLIDPVKNVRNGVETIATLAGGDRLAAEIGENRADLISQYAVPNEILEQLEGETVAIEPSEDAAIWAYELDWKPLPVFQPYVAWTEDLDRQNAEAMASPDGPQRILRQNLNALGRYPGYESPAAMLAMLCNFEALTTTAQWQLLARVPDRCGQPRSLESAQGTYGTAFAIPDAPPGNVVYAEVEGIGVSGLERVRTTLLRSLGRQVQFTEGGRLFTLIPETAGDGLLMRAPRALDFPGAFALAPNSESVTFLLEGASADNPITVEFFAMPVQPTRGRGDERRADAAR